MSKRAVKTGAVHRAAALPFTAVVAHQADERDAVAKARDAAADKRETDPDRAEFLAPQTNTGTPTTGPSVVVPRSTGRHSKDDRTASHDDRDALTEGNAEQETDET